MEAEQGKARLDGHDRRAKAGRRSATPDRDGRDNALSFPLNAAPGERSSLLTDLEPPLRRAAPPRAAIATALLSRRGLGGLGVAAVGLAVGGFFLIQQGQAYGTTRGEIRRVPLGDGSLVALNTETTVDVRMKPEARQVRLMRGEAWFKVAPDHNRPFKVQAGPIQVVAVGTAFSVRRYDNGVDVLVTEGVVHVRPENDRAALTLRAGQGRFISDGGVADLEMRADEEIVRALAWRAGEIDLDGQPLGQAVQEINRYNVRQIRVADPAMANERVYGVFKTGQPDAFARAAATAFGARVTTSDGGDIVIAAD